ncbi:MAG TPA: hypothetical protein VFT13_10800, partial [Candidatus Krumholzibacteria bacterium]|nr:hypothetical protein [Candidatus Krumholzibacteria bacterium]
MKLTIGEALQMVSKQAMAEVPPAPSYAGAWLRAQYLRRQELQARHRLLQTVLPAAVAALGLPGLVLWKGAWLQDDA